MLELVLLSFFAGAAFTVILQILWFKRRLGQLPPLSPPFKDQFPKIKLPKELRDQCTHEDLSRQKEPCLWFNLVSYFLYQELRDTQQVRRWMMKKMNLEFEELLQTLSGKFIDQITVRDFSLGNNCPVLSNVKVRNVSLSEDRMEELDIGADVDYAGGLQLAIDILLLFNKSAYLSVTVKKLKGPARLKLSRTPYTHWSVCFCEDPEVEFEVESQFEGKGLPQITNFIINQIRRSLRKRHTLPHFKMRFKPFFIPPSLSRGPLHEFRVDGQNIGVGQLKVTVIECSRLLKTPPDAKLYCTMSVDPMEWKELVTMKRRVWMRHDVEIIKGQAVSIGMTFREENLLDRFDVVVVVDSITPDTPADKSDIKKNDILLSVGTTRITSCKQAAKLIKTAGERFIIRLERPQMKMSQDVKFFEETISYKDGELETLDDAGTNEEAEEFVHICLKASNDSDAGSVKSPKLEKPSLSSSNLQVSSAAEVRHRSKSTHSSHSADASPVRLTHRKTDSHPGFSDSTLTVKHDVSPQRERSGSDPGLVMKALADDGDSIQGMDVDSDSDDDMYNVQKIPEIPACKNPKWNKEVVFDLGDQHRFLNICVRCKIPEKVDKSDRVVKHTRDLLIGQVSLPLSDVTLCCLMTLQGDTQQTVYLEPGEMKAGASRPKSENWTGHPGYEPHLCYGDITLAFHFTPLRLSQLERSRIPKESVQPDVVECVSGKDLGQEDDLSLTSQDIKLPLENQHNLTLTQFQSATYCNFCGKKIWMKTACKCDTCTMICHKKCVDRCQNETLCTKDGPKVRSNPQEVWVTPVTVKKKSSEESRTGRLLSKLRNKDMQSSSPAKHSLRSPADGGSVLGSNTETDGDISPRPSRKFSPTPRPRLPFLKSDQSDPMFPVDSSSDSEDEKVLERMLHDPQTQVMGNNLDEAVITAAKQMGKELFAHMGKEERMQKLDDGITKLQQEIDQETENKVQLLRAAKKGSDKLQRQFFETQAAKSDEKINAMMTLLVHYCAGLQHCLDVEEDVRQQGQELTAQPSQQSNTATPGMQEDTQEVPSLLLPPSVNDVGSDDDNNGSDDDGDNDDFEIDAYQLRQYGDRIPDT